MNLWEKYLTIYAEAISTHCEKPLGFISEPVNTISNIAFFISAFFIYRMLNKNRSASLHIYRLLLLAILVGLGSTAYHGFNNPYTLILDQLPIYAFIIYSLYIFTSFVSKNLLLRFIIPISLVLVQILVLRNVPAFILDIPTVHITNLLFVTLLLTWFYKRLGKITLKIIPPILIYTLAITVRGFDMPVCPLNNFGTHFLWHILTALTLYLTVKGLIEIDKMYQLNK